jgi:phospholipid/cholesterol/gamma-HCH transport system substrate-binding protein
VATLIQGGTRLTSVVNDQEQEVRELLRQLRRVSEVLASRDDELVRILDDFGAVVAELAERRQDLRDLLRETNAASATAADIVAENRADLDRILTELHATTEILSRYQMDLAEALAYTGDSIEGFASIGFSGNVPVPWGHVFVTSLGPAGIDALVGCGGLVDRQLDQILGPDPRTCEEQENQTLPGDRDSGIPEIPLPGGPITPPALPPLGPPQELGLDEVFRRALPAGALEPLGAGS